MTGNRGLRAPFVPKTGFQAISDAVRTAEQAIDADVRRVADRVKNVVCKHRATP